MSHARSPAARFRAPPPPSLRASPVRPRAPCPVVQCASLPARGAPAPFSFGEPTLIEATVPTEPPPSVFYSPHWNWICRGDRWNRITSVHAQLAPASSRSSSAVASFRSLTAKLIFARQTTRDPLPAAL